MTPSSVRFSSTTTLRIRASGKGAPTSRRRSPSVRTAERRIDTGGSRASGGMVEPSDRRASAPRTALRRGLRHLVEPYHAPLLLVPKGELERGHATAQRQHGRRLEQR